MAVGFRPKNGDTVYWQNGEKTTFTDTGSVFPNTPRAFYARYGQPKSEPDPDKRSTRLIVEAETVFGQLGRAMMNAAEDPNNPWGLKFSGIPEATPLELHDFAATQMPRGWAGSDIKKTYFDSKGGTTGNEGANPDGMLSLKIPSPTIYKISSPEPGKIHLAWRTRMDFQYTFVVRAFSFGNQILDVSAGTAREAVVTLPAGIGGLIEFRVVAMKAGVLGAEGPSRLINVKAKDQQEGTVPTPTVPVIPSKPEPDRQTPTPVGSVGQVGPSGLSPASQRVDELWAWVNRDLWPLLRPAAILILEFTRGVLSRWRSK